MIFTQIFLIKTEFNDSYRIIVFFIFYTYYMSAETYNCQFLVYFCSVGFMKEWRFYENYISKNRN